MMSKRGSLLFYKPVENTWTSIEQQIFLLMCYISLGYWNIIYILIYQSGEVQIHVRAWQIVEGIVDKFC